MSISLARLAVLDETNDSDIAPDRPVGSPDVPRRVHEGEIVMVRRTGEVGRRLERAERVIEVVTPEAERQQPVEGWAASNAARRTVDVPLVGTRY